MVSGSYHCVSTEQPVTETTFRSTSKTDYEINIVSAVNLLHREIAGAIGVNKKIIRLYNKRSCYCLMPYQTGIRLA